MKQQLKLSKKIFTLKRLSDEETLTIIKKFNSEEKFILDPHTATAFGAANKINNLSEIIILGTAHPYKFLETIKEGNWYRKLQLHPQLSNNDR